MNCRYVVHRLASIVTKQLNTFSPCPRGLPATQDQLSRARSTDGGRWPSREEAGPTNRWDHNQTATAPHADAFVGDVKPAQELAAMSQPILAGTAVTTGLALGPPQVKLCESTVKHMAWMGYRLRSARSYLVSKAKNFSMRFQEAIKP
jgi:hypothetical protein